MRVGGDGRGEERRGEGVRVGGDGREEERRGVGVGGVFARGSGHAPQHNRAERERGGLEPKTWPSPLTRPRRVEPISAGAQH